ncbi:oxygenase MpaB family protein [Nocardia stercoris]|uniref:DUF2236 domain-containing protein n=1 Tax=Nocardia stercoris TaxID=2483361 RepID=A0A3M2LD33_9NOCA|nr:oxygenase MpaB family protein [Nocardia stercoris]RMI35006.1 DUF2236 domain-containing protein [Nocardia stercoris]
MALHTGTATREVDVSRFIDLSGALVSGMANVVLQLSHRPVGYGVLESTVDSGKVTLHPVKRTRTTLTYVAVALLGTDEERAAYRAAVGKAHRHVHDREGSPVRYNAFDPDLQLWVAACLYWGAADLYRRMHGTPEPALADALYRHSSRFGTTLQVRESQWPADRAAFAEYWDQAITRVRIDPPVKEYLDNLIDLTMFSWVTRRFAPIHRFVVTGLLPPQVRAQMGMTWTDRDERTLNRALHTIGAVEERIPASIRSLSLRVYLYDLRIRRRLGRPLV